MSFSAREDDFYAILGLPRTATERDITRSYHTLARQWHPDKDRNNVDATARFQKLGRAYETLKDADRRAKYDLVWAQQRGFHASQFSAASRNSEASGKEGANCEDEKLRKEADALEARLTELRNQKTRLNSEMLECDIRIRNLQSDLKRFQEQDEQDARIDRENRGWWTYFTSTMYGGSIETELNKNKREENRLNRAATARIRQAELTRSLAVQKEKESAKQCVEDSIAIQTRKLADVRRKQETVTQEKQWRQWEEIVKKQREERCRREEEMRKQMEERLRREQEMRKQREEDDRKEKARMAETLRRAREAEETKRKANESTRRAEEAEEIRKRAAESTRQAQEADKTRRKGGKSTRQARDGRKASGRSSDPCKHQAYWTQVNGRGCCGRCSVQQNKFVFQCPDCAYIACSACRNILKSEGRQSRPGG